MMQQAIKRSFTFVQPRMATMVTVNAPSRAFATLQEKEKAEEKAYFSKKDAKLLKALVEKMEANNEQESVSSQEHCAMTDDLEAIFQTHNMDKNGKHSLLWQEIMEWRRHKY